MYKRQGNYHWYSAQLTDQTMEQTQQIIEQAGSNINTYINELYRLTLTPYYNDELLHTLEQTATSPQQQLEFKRVVEGFLASVMSLPRSEKMCIRDRCRSLWPFSAWIFQPREWMRR